MIKHLTMALLLLTPVAQAADTVAPMITLDPPVSITNESDTPLYVQYYAEMKHLPHLIKSSQKVPAKAKGLKASGIFYYAKQDTQSGKMDQDNKVTVHVYSAKQPRTLLAQKVIHLKLWDASDIEKDELETLEISIGEDYSLDIEVQGPQNE